MVGTRESYSTESSFRTSEGELSLHISYSYPVRGPSSPSGSRVELEVSESRSFVRPYIPCLYETSLDVSLDPSLLPVMDPCPTCPTISFRNVHGNSTRNYPP